MGLCGGRCWLSCKRAHYLSLAPVVLILSELCLCGGPPLPPAGAGAILVNPWNINDLSQAIEYALMMGDTGGLR